MPSRKREVKPVVSTSFPDLLGEEEARLNRRENYPSEVTIASKAKREEAEADGLLDELLNDDDEDDDTLTNSCDDRSAELSARDYNSQEKAKFEKPKDDANQSSFLGGLLSFSSPPATSSSGSNSNKSSKHVTYSQDVKVVNEPSDDTSKTDSDGSFGREEEEEEVLVIESDDEDEGTEAGQEVELLEEENIEKAEEVINVEEEQEGNEDSDEEYDEDEEDDEEDDEEEGSVTSSSSNATQDLLERAHDRLNMQGLYEEVNQLRKIIERKDEEIDNLSGQLRRAVATKCDLVIAHTELERHHEFNLTQLEECTKQLVKANFGLVEEQASTDVVSVDKNTLGVVDGLEIHYFSHCISLHRNS